MNNQKKLEVNEEFLDTYTKSEDFQRARFTIRYYGKMGAVNWEEHFKRNSTDDYRKDQNMDYPLSPEDDSSVLNNDRDQRFHPQPETALFNYTKRSKEKACIEQFAEIYRSCSRTYNYLLKKESKKYEKEKELKIDMNSHLNDLPKPKYHIIKEDKYYGAKLGTYTISFDLDDRLMYIIPLVFFCLISLLSLNPMLFLGITTIGSVSLFNVLFKDRKKALSIKTLKEAYSEALKLNSNTQFLNQMELKLKNICEQFLKENKENFNSIETALENLDEELRYTLKYIDIKELSDEFPDNSKKDNSELDHSNARQFTKTK